MLRSCVWFRSTRAPALTKVELVRAVINDPELEIWPCTTRTPSILIADAIGVLRVMSPVTVEQAFRRASASACDVMTKESHDAAATVAISVAVVMPCHRQHSRISVRWTDVMTYNTGRNLTVPSW